MEPMNAFLTQHRESFKSFIDDICYVPTALSTAPGPASAASSPTYTAGVASAETHLSYTTPMTIAQRLPPTSREGFPSLPYLIDQARSFADLVNLWLEITNPAAMGDHTTPSQKRHADTMQAIQASEGDLVAFHEICTTLDRRSKECLSRAERAERPNSALSFHWEELIDQLQSNTTSDGTDELPSETNFDTVAEKIASDPSILPPGMLARISSDAPRRRRRRDPAPVTDEDEEDDVQSSSHIDPTPYASTSTMATDAAQPHPREQPRERPSSARGSSFHGSLRRALHSRGSDHSPSASATASQVSSAVSSDAEHTTALPNYEREVRHRERREAARQQIQQQVEEAKIRDRDKEQRRKMKTPLAALKRRKEREGGASGARRGVDMSHV